MFLAEPGGAGLLGRGEGIEAFVGPIIEDCLEGRQDFSRLEGLQKVDALLFKSFVETAREHLNFTV